MEHLSFTTFIIILTIQKCFGFSFLEPTNITTPNLVRDAGYPFEEHQVTTKDGYILTLHRIPYSPHLTNGTDRQTLPIAFLQHGLIASSIDWVGLGPPNALGYVLSDQGYDVWLGNSRGNRYSMGHVEKDYHLPPYWDFSWHEMGIYDLPAVFDYISKKTGVDQFQYVGHSQGVTEFLVYCIFNPCNSKIKSAHLLAPVAFTKNIRSPIVPVAAPFLGQPDPLVKIIGSFDFLPNTEFGHIVGEIFCNDYSNIQFLCADFVYVVGGPSNSLNESMIPFLAGAYPAGSSFKQFTHYFQLYNSGKFRQFDYGPALNTIIYENPSPTDYNLNNIFDPIYLYYGDTDFLADPKDVFHLSALLPEGVLRSLYKVPSREWNHVDFLYGNNVKSLVYDEVLKNIRENE